jgi:hypothetical protein
MFNHVIDGHSTALSVTPEAVPFCSSLFSSANGAKQRTHEGSDSLVL